MPDTMRKVPRSMATMVFDPFAKRRTDITPEAEEQNYRQAFTTYCGECMEAYGLQAGKLANRRVGECGICGNDGFLVGNMSADSSGVSAAKSFIEFKLKAESILSVEHQPGKDLE